jgi:Holliday junction resolvase RusA-like endonuclease
VTLELPAWQPVLHMTIQLLPIAQPRPRARGIQLPGGRITARVYHQASHPVTAYREEIAYRVRQEWPDDPLEGPLRLDLAFVFPRLQRLMWKRKDMNLTRKDTKPDTDNLRKPVMDCITGIVWKDDSQVCDGWTKKFYAAGDEGPFVELKLFKEIANQD